MNPIFVDNGKSTQLIVSVFNFISNVCNFSVSSYAQNELSEEGRKMKDKKKKKKKKPQEVQVVQYQKPDIYHLVDESDLEHIGGHGGGGLHHGGLMHHIGGLHKKKHGRSIGGLFGRFEASAILFGFGTLKCG